MVPSHRRVGCADAPALFPRGWDLLNCYSRPRFGGYEMNKVAAGGTPATPATLVDRYLGFGCL